MITIESTSNKDLIFSCDKTPANEVIVIIVVAVLNYLDKRRTYTIGGLHWQNTHQEKTAGNTLLLILPIMN